MPDLLTIHSRSDCSRSQQNQRGCGVFWRGRAAADDTDGADASSRPLSDEGISCHDDYGCSLRLSEWSRLRAREREESVGAPFTGTWSDLLASLGCAPVSASGNGPHGTADGS